MRRSLSFLIVIGLVVFFSQSPALADDSGHSTTWQDETGGSAPVGPEYRAPVSDLPALAAKDRAAERITNQLTEDLKNMSTAGVSPNSYPAPPGGPRSWTASGWGFQLYKEGQGWPCNPGTTGCTPIGHRYYTCGPSATRNMVRAMTGHNYSEHDFAIWEDDDPGEGTVIGNIAATLNWGWGHHDSQGHPHFGTTYGSWHVHEPTSKLDLFGYIVSDTYNYNQGLIQNVVTKYWAFYNNHNIHHYDVAIGYATESNHYNVRIAEEYNPVFTWGYLPSGYGTHNPYGHHHVWLYNEWRAVHNSTSHRLVV